MVLILRHTAFINNHQFPDQYALIPDIDHLDCSDSSPCYSNMEEKVSEIAAPGIHNTQDSNSHASMKSTNSKTDLMTMYSPRTCLVLCKLEFVEGKMQLPLYFEMFGIRFAYQSLLFATMIPLRIAV